MIHIPMSHFFDVVTFTTMEMTMIAMWIHCCLWVVCTWEKAMIEEKRKSDEALYSKKISTDERMFM